MSDEAPIAVEFEFTPEDWREANLAHITRSPLQLAAARRARRWIVGMFSVGALAFTLIDGLAVGLSWLVAGGVLTALGPLLHRVSVRQALRRMARAGVANGTFGPHRVEVRPEGLADVTPDYEWLVRWHAIESVQEHHGTFFVYTGANSFMPIPGSAFRDAETLRGFSQSFYERLATAREAGRPRFGPPPVTE
ncbi:MAG: hypothetical protein D6701_06510 [Gemmatimonadetes bacterium]|nr:MAG: hypothetical protein D6701_06510 [Gemmatimonadota bacterium]